jgi:hypothetical protein
MGSRTLLALMLALAAPGLAAQRPRAAGGVDLVMALEEAVVAAVGRVEEVEHLDVHGYAARLRVERSFSEGVAPGAVLSLAWEELASSRAPRLAPGERVLVALEPLPGASLWSRRLPDPARRRQTLALARRGDAFLRDPSLASLGRLEHYLALTPEDRRGPLGVAYLAELAARAEPSLARSAVARLGTVPDLDASLDAESSRALVAALVRSDGAGVGEAVVELVESRRPEPLHVALEMAVQALERDEALPPPVLVAALARFEGLGSARGARLIERGTPEHRTVAARFATGPEAQAELVRLLRRDPAAEVRCAAVARLVEIAGESALEPALAALSDPEPSVRMASAQALGDLGAGVVARLRETAFQAETQAAEAAVVAITLTHSREAERALSEIAKRHPDDSVRRLAGLAQDRRVGHRD